MKELGNAQFKNQNYSAAADYYTKGIQLNSSEPVLYANRGTCLKCLGRYKEVKKSFVGHAYDNRCVKRKQYFTL